MRIYKNIKLRCTAMDISVAQLERALGFTRGAIYKWDRNTPAVDKVIAVAKALRCSVEDLVKEGK